MASLFNYSEFAKIFAIYRQSYRFANPEKAANESSNPKAAGNEYRKGLENISKGLIDTFDTGEKDGRLNFDEFATQYADIMERTNYYLNRGEDVDSLSDTQRQEFFRLRDLLKEMHEKQAKESFNTLDLNEDGFIDYKEQASEISLADASDRMNRDGTIDLIGFRALYNYKVSPSELKQKLRNEYDTMNLENLGEKGDIK